MDRKLKHGIILVSDINHEHVLKAKDKHDIDHVSEVHQEHLHESSDLAIQLKHFVLQMDHVFEVEVLLLTILTSINSLSPSVGGSVGL